MAVKAAIAESCPVEAMLLEAIEDAGYCTSHVTLPKSNKRARVKSASLLIDIGKPLDDYKVDVEGAEEALARSLPVETSIFRRVWTNRKITTATLLLECDSEDEGNLAVVILKWTLKTDNGKLDWQIDSHRSGVLN